MMAMRIGWRPEEGLSLSSQATAYSQSSWWSLTGYSSVKLKLKWVLLSSKNNKGKYRANSWQFLTPSQTTHGEEEEEEESGEFFNTGVTIRDRRLGSKRDCNGVYWIDFKISKINRFIIITLLEKAIGLTVLFMFYDTFLPLVKVDGVSFSQISISSSVSSRYFLSSIALAWLSLSFSNSPQYFWLLKEVRNKKPLKVKGIVKKYLFLSHLPNWTKSESHSSFSSSIKTKILTFLTAVGAQFDILFDDLVFPRRPVWESVPSPCRSSSCLDMNDISYPDWPICPESSVQSLYHLRCRSSSTIRILNACF